MSTLLLPMMSTKIHRYNSTYNCLYTNSLFSLCMEFHAACMQTKFCQSCCITWKSSRPDL